MRVYLILIFLVLVAACVAQKDWELRHAPPLECPPAQECNCDESWELFFNEEIEEE